MSQLMGEEGQMYDAWMYSQLSSEPKNTERFQ